MRNEQQSDSTWLLVGVFVWSAFVFILGAAGGLVVGRVVRTTVQSTPNLVETPKEAAPLRERLAQEMMLRAECLLQDAFLAQKVSNVMVSWYGEPYHGRTAASGIVYNMNLRHLAHRSLPFGTVVSFFNPNNCTFSYGVVIDRGPFVDGREYDLSRLMIQELGLEEQGIGMVRSWIITLGNGKVKREVV